MTLASPFPLEKVTKSQLLEVARSLWSWPSCEDCSRGQTCGLEPCPHYRLNRLEPFFNYYKDLTSSYEPDSKPGDPLALNTHDDLIGVFEALRLNAAIPRAQLLENAFPDQAGPQQQRVPNSDQENAIDLAMKVMLMINCAGQNHSPILLEHGIHSAPWPSTVSLTELITEKFPTSDYPNINDIDDNGNKGVTFKAALTAKKLKKRARLTFRPTDDLRSHLKLDSRDGTVEIFHHTAFLKEHLRLTRDKPRNLSVAESLKLGALPRQLALEVLDSIQKILFPIEDSKSRALLGSLISKSNFDPDCSRFESASIRLPDEKDISYYYFGARLSDLFEELENPTPRGMEKWFERKSGARYVMMATLVGVGIAVLLGFLGLAVSSYQAWLGYQQWQHPVSTA